MEKRIVYPTANGKVYVIVPSPDTAISVEEIARKDTPAGVPFLIVDVDQVPEDRTFRDAWTADFSNPHGHGIGAEAWFAEQAQKEVVR